MEDVIDSTSDLKVTENEINYDDSRPHLKPRVKTTYPVQGKPTGKYLKTLETLKTLHKNTKSKLKQQLNIKV